MNRLDSFGAFILVFIGIVSVMGLVLAIAIPVVDYFSTPLQTGVGQVMNKEFVPSNFILRLLSGSSVLPDKWLLQVKVNSQVREVQVGKRFGDIKVGERVKVRYRTGRYSRRIWIISVIR